MGRYASVSEEHQFEEVAPGTYPARCVKLVELGTQRQTWEGKESFRNKLWIQWELPEELMSSGKPYVVSGFFTYSLNEKSGLYQLLVSWRGREFTPEEAQRFDMESILAAPCLLSIVHSDKGRARVQSAVRLPKGMKVADAGNEPWALWLDPTDFRRDRFDTLSEGLQNMIRSSPEWAKLQGDAPAPAQQELEDDVPF